MNPNELPQIDKYQDIQQLLKIGNFAVHADENPQAPEVNEEINIRQLVREKLDEAKILANPAIQKIQPYKGFLIYPIVFFGSFLFFYSAINLPSLVAQAQGLFAKS